MKRKAILGTTALLALACCAQAQTEEGAKCTTETLKGAYGVLLTGTNLAAVVAPGRAGLVGQLQQAIGTDIIVFDGKGNFTQTDNVKGTVSGLSPDRPGSGTYVVNPDCSYSSTVQPAPGITIVTKGVIVDGGKGYFGFTVTPDAVNIVVTGRQIK